MKRTGFHSKRRGKACPGGYTLVELLTVMSIAAVLMTLIVQSMRGMLDSSNLTRAGQLIGDQVNLARQIASATNSTVEVRLLNVAKTSSTGYSAVQIWGTNRSGSSAPLRNAVVLPPGSIVSQNSQISPVFSSSLSLPLTTGTMPDGGNYGGARYASFQVRPTGTVLPAIEMKSFCFTIVPLRLADKGTLPANYVTIQVNPLTASAFIYRP